VFYGVFSLVVTVLWGLTVKEKGGNEKPQPAAFSMANIKQIVTNRYILGLCVIIFFAFSMLAGLTNYMDDLIAEKGLLDPAFVYLAAVLSLGTTLGNIIFPTLSDKVGRRRIFLVACSMVAILLLILIQLTTIGMQLWILILCLGLMIGALIPLCLTICIDIETLPEALAGTISGVVLTMGFLGGFSVSLVFGAFLVMWNFLPCILYLIGFGIAAFSLSFLQKT
jgi:MFS family permease